MEPEDMDSEDKQELAALRADVHHLIQAVEELKQKFNGHTTVESFSALKDRVAVIEKINVPIQTFDALQGRVSILEKIAFGAIAFVLLAVLGAVVALVVRR